MIVKTLKTADQVDYDFGFAQECGDSWSGFVTISSDEFWTIYSDDHDRFVLETIDGASYMASIVDWEEDDGDYLIYYELH